ncbi:hypothetical protein BFJ68_g16693 [Fusarium oxysporum]|uniref:Zn(2)-C6 fungal-type domain-containing protein n=2 Tax=Fusarium oxysporum TaxID=5507 RepID=A0A420PAH7_FUSOX|nr:hypothetical protein BFJ65_g18505 [Fusarium oxysporum f. sp. cepae]RKK27054.1 hypothetical protein BFJ67_g16326 [Fusarium oxysporum f. sp. cepae]RKK27682.1 hypothetical protein BFJ66_g16540 [Fusarium oxysporum f. sp. cepae]RKK65204.1 hypothetical protein BFJ69_g16495 [Fusarium oxysporum]RKK89514.1 hypothetical protein BFJ68_g16693 [Fusarium oxysporum]
MATSSGPRRACKLCRRRKVKCDGCPTCNNCRAAGTACQYAPPKKRGPKPVRYCGSISDDTPTPISPHTDPSEIREDPSLPSPATCLQPTTAVSQTEHSCISSSQGARPASLSESQTEAAVRIYLDFLAGLQTPALVESSASIANRCIFLYTRYVFGSVPLCHEASLRATVTRFFDTQPHSPCEDALDTYSWALRCFSSDDEYSEVEKLRSLTLLLAMCAAVSYAVPESLLPTKHLTAPLFLKSTRELLNIYHDYDLEHPDSSSLNIRMFLSSAIQTSTGTNGVAFHILGEAGLIAMRMRLYCEISLEGRDAIEQQILRNVFWQLYVCDKTVLVMGGRPVSIHETLFDTQLSLKSSSPSPVTLFEYGPESSGAEIEGRLMEGFHIIRRLWAMAARVIRGMESRSTGHTDKFTDLYQEDMVELSKAYFEIITLTNCFPAWDPSPAALSPDTDREVDTGLNNILQRQKTSYLISLHSIKFFVLNSAISCNMTQIVGLSAEPLSLAMRLIELAQDFFNVLETIPFLHLQAEGEQCAEKIRRVGSLLLELAHNYDEEVVTSRASQCVQRSVNLLVRLDSKASDSIGSLI